MLTKRLNETFLHTQNTYYYRQLLKQIISLSYRLDSVCLKFISWIGKYFEKLKSEYGQDIIP